MSEPLWKTLQEFLRTHLNKSKKGGQEMIPKSFYFLLVQPNTTLKKIHATYLHLNQDNSKGNPRFNCSSACFVQLLCSTREVTNSQTYIVAL